MKNVFFLLFLILSLVANEIPELVHGVKYRDQNVSGWLMSEKLDGVRAVWDGKKLLTRQGNPLFPHPDFTDNFPPFPLDGELWTEPNDFEKIASIVNDGNTSLRWLQLTYNIFEVPDTKGDFFTRMAKVRQWFRYHPTPYVKVIKQIPVVSRAQLDRFLTEIERKGGEGVMVKNPYAPYTPGRTPNLLKVKSYDDMEGRVIGYKTGKGKFKGLVGSLHIELEKGIRFYLGSGLTLKDRKDPPPLGSIVTFKYYGFTKSGKPRFASFMRLRSAP